MENENVKRMYMQCDCCGEGLMLEDDPECKGVWIAQFTFGSYEDFRLTWRQRIRYCWQVLTKGQPFADQNTISYKKAKQVADFLHDVVGNEDI